MRAQLVHLSGPLRGRTVTYDGANLLIGTDPDATIRFAKESGVARRHAEIAFVADTCAFYLRPIDGAVFVGGREIAEVILEDGDLIEIGAGGPRARFRIHVDPGKVCKPVHTMLRDATDVGRQSGAFAFTGSMVRDLLVHATWQLKVGVPLLLALGLVVAFGAGWLGGGRASVADDLAALRQQVDELKKGQEFSATTVEALRGELAERSEALDALRSTDAAVARVHDVHARGVCLLHGAYGLRAPGESGAFVTDIRGGRLVVEYTGSGFAVSAAGEIVTNRHVVRPWDVDADVAALLAAGFVPELLTLTATFPGRAPVDVDRTAIRVRDGGLDVAVVRADVAGVPLLPLSDEDPAALRGTRVVVVGYPTGVNALLAKADHAVVDAVVAGDPTLTDVIVRLAAHDAIAPVITSGTLGDVRRETLVYDAQTTGGGSGGPVFSRSGRVIGVNYAIMPQFGGSNFGVPIRFARELLAP